MKRLTLNQNNEIKVKDIYGKIHDCKDVPHEFYGCIPMKHCNKFNCDKFNGNCADCKKHWLESEAEE
jgi:hypothetical protein